MSSPSAAQVPPSATSSTRSVQWVEGSTALSLVLQVTKAGMKAWE